MPPALGREPRRHSPSELRTAHTGHRPVVLREGRPASIAFSRPGETRSRQAVSGTRVIGDFQS